MKFVIICPFSVGVGKVEESTSLAQVVRRAAQALAERKLRRLIIVDWLLAIVQSSEALQSSVWRLEIHDRTRFRIGERRRSVCLGRIDPDGVDLLLYRFGVSTGRLYLSIPTPREKSAGFAKIKTGDIGALLIRLRIDVQQTGRRIVARIGAHTFGVLAGHQGMVAKIITCRFRSVPGRPDIR